MNEQTYVAMIDVKLITPSPMNPRKHFSGQAMKELIDSIKQKGVIEPIVIRPVEGKETPYEIVVGERRYKAVIATGLDKIPAIIRELTDEETYDFMLIENLHRDDLTDREEAESFKAYIDRHGDVGIPNLAEKTGIHHGYIRSRIRVLELPAKVLRAWEKGELAFGHLQQLLRVPEEACEELFGWIMDGGDSWSGIPTVKELADHIAEAAPPLSAAFFKTKEHCSKCVSNSLIQRALFDIEGKKAHCLNPACFRQMQEIWLDEHWQETALAEEYGTNGYRFREDISWGDVETFRYVRKPKKKCRECPFFVSVITIHGQVDEGKACAGDKACFRAVTQPRTEKEQKTGERDPAAPRAVWHGEYFRDVFLCQRIAEVLAGIDPEDPRIKELLLACAVHNHYSDLPDLAEELLGEDAVMEVDFDGMGGWILEISVEWKREAYKKVIEAIVFSGQHVGEGTYNGSFGTLGRQIVARYLGIDLAREFAVDRDYLEKKTKAEILAFGKKFKLFKPEEVNKLKKTELIKLVLDHGDKLIGKVPAEILKG
ncbi:MAG: ParB/RepB/Spo0J family partition protein [Deltaproteobacteria bacterium]|nr:ParB/RepB/Spo0J family partition protein [Deltaproteobacteria bacterium]